MAIYNEVGSGGVTVAGCVIDIQLSDYSSGFKVGSVVYVREDALKGILTPIFIKEVRANTSRAVGRTLLPQYIDALNAIYFDSDLVTQVDAIALATAYEQNRIAAIQAYLNKIC